MRFPKAVLLILLLSLTGPIWANSADATSQDLACEAALFAPTATDTLSPDTFIIDPVRQTLRQEFIATYADLIFSDEAQNQIWIDDALDPNAEDSFHVLIENAWIKNLNDKILKNKDLVTALTNFHKTLFIEELRATGLDTRFAAYHDFKSIRLTLSPKSGPIDFGALERAFVQTQKRFYADASLRKILRAQDLKENWFRMGIGHSEAQAALAARYARENNVNQGLAYYWDPQVLDSLETKLRDVQAMHAQIVKRLSGSKLLERRPRTTLGLDVYAAARKSTPSDFLAALREIFPHENLDEEIAQLIFRFTTLADEFSPSVLVAKRELLSIHDAPFGAISIDFIGLGAENLAGTVKALVGAKNLNDAVRLTRSFERKVTLEFEKRKARVAAVVYEQFGPDVSIRFSGDDGIIIPRRAFFLREQMLLVGQLSSLMKKPYFRMAVIGSHGAGSADSSQLITHGESMEKTLRKMMVRDLGPKRTGEISLQLFIPDAGHHRKVFLLLGARSKLNAVEQKKLRNLFTTAVSIVQNQATQMGLEIDYAPVDIFAIYGWKKSNSSLTGKAQ